MSISQKIHSEDKIVSLFDNMYVLLYVNYFILPDFPFFNYSGPYTPCKNAVYNNITPNFRITISLYRNFANQIVKQQVPGQYKWSTPDQLIPTK